MFCFDFICLPHILQGKNYHARVFLCHPGPLSSVILGLDHGIQVMEAVAQRHISHSLDRHGRAAPSR